MEFFLGPFNIFEIIPVKKKLQVIEPEPEPEPEHDEEQDEGKNEEETLL